MGKSFARRIYERMGANAPEDLIAKDDYGHTHILKNRIDNFIDKKEQVKCDIKGELFGAGKKIDYHSGATHLNSSQVMCISFFKKFFEKGQWEDILIKLLKDCGVPITGKSIKEAVFEYIPYYRERTNFDFYLVLDDGSHMSMEIKYTETEFGKVVLNPKNMETYSKKWTNVYLPMVEKSPYLDCSMEEFYENFQINRNVCYASKGDYVVFLTPKENDAPRLVEGRKYIDSLTRVNPRIKNIYWKEFVDKLMPLIKNEPNLLDYYQKFKEKYIDIL